MLYFCLFCILPLNIYIFTKNNICIFWIGLGNCGNGWYLSMLLGVYAGIILLELIVQSVQTDPKCPYFDILIACYRSHLFHQTSHYKKVRDIWITLKMGPWVTFRISFWIGFHCFFCFCFRSKNFRSPRGRIFGMATDIEWLGVQNLFKMWKTILGCCLKG